MSLPQPAPLAQISGPPLITCVDIHGFQVPQTELWTGPSEQIDPTDAASWPVSNETDGWFWEVSQAERLLAEAEVLEEWADAADGPQPRWTDEVLAQAILEGALEPRRSRTLDVEPFHPGPEPLPPIAGGCGPEPFEPTDRDWDDLYAAGREYPEWGILE